MPVCACACACAFSVDAPRGAPRMPVPRAGPLLSTASGGRSSTGDADDEGDGGRAGDLGSSVSISEGPGQGEDGTLSLVMTRGDGHAAANAATKATADDDDDDDDDAFMFEPAPPPPDDDDTPDTDGFISDIHHSEV